MYTYANGENYIGQFLNGNFEGFGILNSANGKILKNGLWRMNKYAEEEEEEE